MWQHQLSKLRLKFPTTTHLCILYINNTIKLLETDFNCLHQLKKKLETGSHFSFHKAMHKVLISEGNFSFQLISPINQAGQRLLLDGQGTYWSDPPLIFNHNPTTCIHCYHNSKIKIQCAQVASAQTLQYRPGTLYTNKATVFNNFPIT